MSSKNRAVELVVFDLDGTLLRGDTVCLALARRLARTERMLEFEGLTVMSEIEKARHEMAEWYRGYRRDDLISILESGIRIASGTAEGFTLLHTRGVKTGIASMTWSFAVEWFARRFGASFWTGTILDFETWQITHSSATHKADFVRTLLRELGLQPDQAAAVGDTWGDVEMLAEVGHRFFVGARVPDLPGVIHLPDADIRSVAEMIVDTTHGS